MGRESFRVEDALDSALGKLVLAPPVRIDPAPVKPGNPGLAVLETHGQALVKATVVLAVEKPDPPQVLGHVRGDSLVDPAVVETDLEVRHQVGRPQPALGQEVLAGRRFAQALVEKITAAGQQSFSRTGLISVSAISAGIKL